MRVRPPTSAVRAGRAFALVAVLVLGASQDARSQDAAVAPPTAADVRKLLDGGDAAAAHATAALALELAPDDRDLVALASAAAEAAGDRDEALWHARRGRQLAVSAGESAGRLKPLDARVVALDPAPAEVRAAAGAALDAYVEAGLLAARRKLWVNAVELLSRCEGTPSEAKTSAALDTIYANDSAVRALLDSGLDVPVARAEKRSPQWIARNDAAHRDWKSAWTVKSANYTVVTNTGWRLANSIAQAMEQMNDFYRKVFRHKERGGGTPRCTIRVYRDQKEYEANVPPDMHDAAGFFQPGENSISTYDPRPRDTIAELWATLNYEDPAHERVYAPHYASYVDAYRTGGKHDTFDRFVEYFVTKPKLQGVATFDDFEARYRAWISELENLRFGPASTASTLLARARGQRAAKQLDAARDSYRWALAKQPRSLAAVIELADLGVQRGDKDRAIALYRRVAELAARLDPEGPVPDTDDATAGELAARAAAAVARLDAPFAKALDEASAGVLRSARDAAAAWAEAGCPHNAVAALDTAARLLGGRRDLVAERDEIAGKHSVDWRTRRRLKADRALPGWRTEVGWTAEGGALVGGGAADAVTTAEWAEDLPDDYRIEVTLRPRSVTGATWVGLTFGLGEDGVVDALGVHGSGRVAVQRYVKEFEVLLDLPAASAESLQDLRLAVDVSGGVATYLVDGKRVGSLDLGEPDLRGRVGFACGGGTVEFRDAVLLHR